MDTTVYKAHGAQVGITKGYLQEILSKILKDTANSYDVYEDKQTGFFFVLIANNVFSLVDNSIDINKKNHCEVRPQRDTSNTIQLPRYVLHSQRDMADCYSYCENSKRSNDSRIIFQRVCI